MFIRVFVTPEAKKERVEEKGEVLAIWVREPAQANRANDRVREIIAARLGKPSRSIRILTGHRGRVKMISISS